MDMLLDLSRFSGRVSRLERRYEPQALEQRDDEFRVVAPVELQGEATRDVHTFHLVGRVTTTLELNCGRCLESFTVPIAASFDVVYVPEGTGAGDAEREVEPDDVSVEFYKDEVIDLGQLMREQFYLALPMKPLCQEDCKGLCPECGINRNRETCACRHEWVDPRLAALKALLKPGEPGTPGQSGQ